uniref:Uncharacterized protein n=1 Tax=Arundo donax TaxID=35708 RepID=A0A0A8ZJY9_ARUDO
MCLLPENVMKMAILDKGNTHIVCAMPVIPFCFLL